MPDYSTTQKLQAIAIVDEMVGRNVGSSGGGTSTSATAANQQTEIARLMEIRDRTIPRSLYERVNTASDMTKTISYADAGDINSERITSVAISSASVGATFTDTYSYAGTAGNYRITSVVRNQS